MDISVKAVASNAAEEEHHEVTVLLESVVLLPEEDTRHNLFLDGNGRLRTTPLYKTLTTADLGSYNFFFKFIWKNHALPRVRFFIWLLVQQCVNCKSNVHRKNIVQDPECDLYREDDR
jgi:hypothetical protein